MDHHSLELRVAQLEKELAFWIEKFKRAGENDSIRFLELQLQIENLQSRVKDFDKIEKIAFDAYVQTHPAAQDDLLDMDRTVDMGVQHLYFANLPSIKDFRSKS